MLVGELGEEALLEKMRRLFSSGLAASPANVIIGIGDDAAVTVPAAGSEVWTTDLLLEGIHFQPEWQTPRELGHKSLAVSLSDVAAMGAAPRYALLSVACSASTTVDYILELCHGVACLAAAHRLKVIGGDTTASGGPLVVSLALSGVIPDGGTAVFRSGARPGDRVFVTGHLGSAAAGLLLLMRQAAGDFPELREAFVRPEPRVQAGMRVRQHGGTGMTDLSDGLAADLRHVCQESGTGARIFQSRLPISDALLRASRRFDFDATSLALEGGEDYELLFTARPENSNWIASAVAAAGVRVTEIGEILPAEHGLLLSGDSGERLFKERGYDHFMAG